MYSQRFSPAVSPKMGAAMFSRAWMSLAMLYWVVSRFLDSLFERKYTPYNQNRTIIEGNWLFKVVGQETCQY